ncbi:MAG: thermonuclease family protein [Hyphomicrobiales bacterium]|nr:thermonuclease family protein [Hyphomicrobiales bacterium]
MRASLRLLAAWFALVLVTTQAQASDDSGGACDATAATPVELAAIDEKFDLVLADGRIAALAGLALDGADDRRALESELFAASLSAAILRAAPDRWGRTAIRLYARAGADGARDVAVDWLRRGLARYRPDPETHPCRRALLAAEDQARRAHAGLWADPAAVISGTDRDAIAAAAPDLVVVEGAVASVGEARGRTYLNLGPSRMRDLAIVIWTRDLAAFAAEGLVPRRLVGRRIRARGLLDRRFGPHLELVSPDALELLEEPPGGGRANEGKGAGR